MAPQETRLTQRASYRHGDVRAEAVDRALASIEEVGEQGIAMRAIAQALGVAHRTLHHHFADREGLLREVSARGFALLADVLDAEQTERGFVIAYLRFGLARPQLYTLMMRQRADAGQASPALGSARDRVIARALAVLAPDEADPDAGRRRVMRTWMTLHGGLALNASSTLMARDPEQFEAEMLRIVEPGEG
ncbi:MAG: TetR/AcrR family transcriptional regulator [Erythrobacter sp.]